MRFEKNAIAVLSALHDEIEKTGDQYTNIATFTTNQWILRDTSFYAAFNYLYKKRYISCQYQSIFSERDIHTPIQITAAGVCHIESVRKEKQIYRRGWRDRIIWGITGLLLGVAGTLLSILAVSSLKLPNNIIDKNSNRTTKSYASNEKNDVKESINSTEVGLDGKKFNCNTRK